jgi:pimeloyl-ACP methyl ester carboxylesterase
MRLATRAWGATVDGDPPGAGGAATRPHGQGPGDGQHPRGHPEPGGGQGLGGRPLAVLVHGVTSSGRTWWRVAPALVERGFDVLTVDLRGHGASPPVAEGLGLADLAADLADTVEAAAGRAPIDLLVGHSLGALVVSQLLATRPGLARRLVLEDPPGLGTTDWAALADGIEADGARARNDPDGLRRQLQAESTDWVPGEAERRVADLAACDATGIAAALRRGVVYDLPALVRSAGVPTLLLLGEEALGSALAGPDRAALVAALGQGTVEVLRAGHNLHREAFGAFLAAIDRWLASAARFD